MGILAVGMYFYKKNTSREDFYVGGRSISSGHIGLSIAATDVGGGFSIGLGGLGFTMGLAGTWLLFTGLIGAWLAAVLTVPKLKKLDMQHGLFTFPDFLALKYNRDVATIAALISGIGYLGFTSGQILAGGKLAAASVFSTITWADPLFFSLVVMALVVVIYTVMGGLKAVIYTDTVQWIVLLSGLLFLGFPFAYYKLGGWEVINNALPDSHFSLTNISGITLVNWSFSIIPIWFIAMTLYQRVYASRNVKQAKRAFFIAGIFEYPMLAFVGVGLGMLARVAFPENDPETALPMLLTKVLPIGVAGFVLAAYFSAVMSTADSCLIASSGNFLNDIFSKKLKKYNSQRLIIFSQLVTLIIGVLAFLLATYFTSVLSIVLHSYSFMVSGLLVPTLFAYFSKYTSSKAAMVSMIGGGSLTLFLIFTNIKLPIGLDATIFGIAASFALYLITYTLSTK
ncbi:sodium:solute symporter family protein [Reichenbachiella sp. MALMAid0571]|uniref:sodium:solute symporter family protein n=1 Tax=Reichenbachiella sp. MALMAid0571 TaxID=3143939 RepID=UPI0032DF14DF